MKTTQTLLAAAILLTATGANATLVSALGGQVVNDTYLNITWLADANYAKTSGYDDDGDGKMTWSQAQGWIASLNASNYLGYNDWRLPTTTDTGTSGCSGDWYNGGDCGYNSTGSEMSHLYYTDLGNLGYYNTDGTTQSGYGLVNTGPFTNFQSGTYWSGTEYAPDTNRAWYFIQNFGRQYYYDKNVSLFALAVRPGQVVATPVPGAALLLGSGLLGLIGVARRRLALR